MVCDYDTLNLKSCKQLKYVTIAATVEKRNRLRPLKSKQKKDVPRTEERFYFLYLKIITYFCEEVKSNFNLSIQAFLAGSTGLCHPLAPTDLQ